LKSNKLNDDGGNKSNGFFSFGFSFSPSESSSASFFGFSAFFGSSFFGFSFFGFSSFLPPLSPPLCSL